MQTWDLLSYIDPVSGTMVLQLLVASVAGCASYFLKPICKVLSKMVPRRRLSPQRAEVSASTPEDAPGQS